MRLRHWIRIENVKLNSKSPNLLSDAFRFLSAESHTASLTLTLLRKLVNLTFGKYDHFDSFKHLACILMIGSGDVTLSLKNVFIQKLFISSSEAVQRIFDLTKIDNIKGPKCWNSPFLVCYQNFVIRRE